MATRPARFGRAALTRTEQDQQRREASPWRAWYGTARWAKRRAGQLTDEPLCCMCLAQGLTTPATVADHVKRHRGDYDLFWHGQLQSLCKAHHDRDKQAQEAAERRP